LLDVDVVLKQKPVPKSPMSHFTTVPSGRAWQRKVSVVLFYLLI